MSPSRDLRQNGQPPSRGGVGGQALRIDSPIEMAPSPEEVRGRVESCWGAVLSVDKVHRYFRGGAVL